MHKVLILTRFSNVIRDSHCILPLTSDASMAHEFCSGFAIQNTFMSTVVLIDEVSDVTAPAPIAIKK